ncbi:hypothetical protein GGQ13_002785 [Salinibacter ruber]|uniref:hypothetical protein n=2 Tax=Salinibacter ruber TaxID=146919 RepID=UPI002169C861|nr:hypothetical protein [Salinibacter ruber]MCS4139330.1 hypothetical protein [Salinibacter ruber]MCS4196076.1 hypothetical protein [Salinibacter ruber]
MNEQETTLRRAWSWASRIGGAALMLFLIGVLAWVFAPPGGGWLPAGGAAIGGLIGWKSPTSGSDVTSGSGRIDAGLTYAVRGAALGLLVLFLYQSVRMSPPKEPDGQEPKRETLAPARPLPSTESARPLGAGRGPAETDSVGPGPSLKEIRLGGASD